MNKCREIAEKLNGTEYRERLIDIYVEAERNDIVIVFGASDDLIEFRGAITDEAGCYGGEQIYLCDDEILTSPDCDCEYAMKWYDQQKIKSMVINAKWCDDESLDGSSISWSYDTDIPHETFNIMEDGEIYCVGLVFKLEELSHD